MHKLSQFFRQNILGLRLLVVSFILIFNTVNFIAAQKGVVP